GRRQPCSLDKSSPAQLRLVSHRRSAYTLSGPKGSHVGGTILILVGPEYEDLEVWYPKLRLEEAGFDVKLAGLGEREYRGKHGYPCAVDGRVSDFLAEDLSGIVAPGGWAPDKIRRDAEALRRVREVHAAGKMVATICHGP